MAAPEYVPRPADEVARVYSSPPWRPESWTADRPSDLRTRQPVGRRLGNPGPDQGYVLRLVHQFEGTLVLAEGEHEADAIAGCVGVALKRASLFGRAPVIHDLTIAFTVWGFLAPAPDELVALRGPLFAEVANPHHYDEARMVADLVGESTLRQSPDQVRDQAARDWRSLIDTLDEVPPAPVPEPEPVAVVEPEPEPVAVVEPEPEPEPIWSPPADGPAPPVPAAPPVLRPASKVTPPPVASTRPTARKKVVKKKVVKKTIKKKVVKKKPADGSLFAQPAEEDQADSTADEARKRARDLGQDT